MDNFRVLVFVATLAGVCVTAITFDSPVIKPDDKERVITARNNFTLECTGKYPMTWSFPDNPPTDDNEPAESHISTREPTETDETYGIRLDLYNVTGADVGRYYCLRNTTDSNKDISLAELENNGEAKSIYLYVDDPQILIVPLDSVVSGLQYTTLTIPCKPTSPNIYVKLYRGNDESEKKELELKPGVSIEGRSVKYQKQIGFLITEIGISDASFFYICKAEHNGVSQSTTFMLQITPYTSNIPKPHIQDPFYGRTVVGGKIHLECSIVLDTVAPFSIEWKYPNTDIPKGGITISNTTSQHINGTENFPQVLGKSFLDIHNVTEEDKGVYSCKIIVYGNNNTKTETKTIQVLKKGTSIMKLSEPSNKSHLSSKTGKYLSIVVNIDAFPEPIITWYDNHQQPIISSVKYDVKVSNNQTQLQIRNLTLEDRGAYQVKGTSGNENASLTFTVEVFAFQDPEMDAEEFYLVGIKHNITCTVKGYPLPKIKWFYQECEDVLNCNSSPRQINEFQGEKINDITARGTLTMEFEKSGNLMCYAENKYGRSNISREFYVSDIKDGFGILGAENSIATGDNVSLTCATSALKYKNEHLNWYRMPENTLIKDGRTNDVSNHRYSTNYSNRLTLTISNIQKMYSGNYECRLENMAHGIVPSARLGKALNVTDVEQPKIFMTNLNNTVFPVDLGKPNIKFFCKAKGNPLPKIQWYKNHILFKPKDDRIRISEDDTALFFTHTMEGDEGKYSCIAQNRIGTAEKYVELSLNNGGFNTIYIIIIVILLIVFLILICILIYKIKKEKEIRKELSIMGLLHFEEGATESLNPDLGVDEQAELLPYDKKWEFPREKLKLGKQLGSGAFGVVMKASAYGILEEEECTTVAVKMVKRTADSTLIKALASELKIMVHLGKHLNVVNLLGACTKNVSKRELFVIVEYCRFGNLHNYLLRHRDNFIDQIDHNSGHIDPTIGIDIINRAYSVSSNKSSGLKSAMQPLLRRSSVSRDDSNTDSGALDTVNTVVSMLPTGEDGPITSSGSVQPEWRSNYKGDYNYSKEIRPISTQDLLSWSFQIARGMEYLANRKVLHGDLAARNILLADENIVKICDFGLAKNMYKTDNYKKKGDSPLPVKWMAIESIRDRVFSTQSDIWSYGIVLWELFSLARTPYPGMEADEKFYNRLVEGYRMEKPKHSNKLIYNIMLECWRARPVQRPTFGDLVDKLGHLLEEGVRKHYIDLNDPYMDMNNRWLAERGESDYLAMMSAPDYGNLTSASTKHDYVNEPFGGSTKINPMSPDETDEEGYLRMTPAKNGTPNIASNVFNFPSPASPKIMKTIIREESEDKKHEWVPMLKVENEVKRSGSDSDMGDSLPTSPNQEKSDSNT